MHTLQFIMASVFLIGLGELLCLFARGFRFIVTNRPHAVFFDEANDARVGVSQPLPVEIVRDRIAGIAFVSEPARFLVIIRHMADDQVFAVRRRFERGDELFDIIPFPPSARIVLGAGQVRRTSRSIRLRCFAGISFDSYSCLQIVALKSYIAPNQYRKR
jgi:hypothetical protein